MKFTDGYWRTKPEYIMNYAQQVYRAEQRAGSLQILASCARMDSLRDVSNTGAFTVKFSTPMKDVLRVEIVHHAGRVDRGPHFEINGGDVQPAFSEDESSWSIECGALRA